jgi:hypothetical protein
MVAKYLESGRVEVGEGALSRLDPVRPRADSGIVVHIGFNELDSRDGVEVRDERVDCDAKEED